MIDREMLKRLYETATQRCVDKIWTEGESTAWAWEERFVEAVVEEVCQTLADNKVPLTLKQVSVLSDTFDPDS